MFLLDWSLMWRIIVPFDGIHSNHCGDSYPITSVDTYAQFTAFTLQMRILGRHWEGLPLLNVSGMSSRVALRTLPTYAPKRLILQLAPVNAVGSHAAALLH